MARREIRKFEKKIQIRFIEAVESLAKNPRPRGVEKVKGHPCFFRFKSGAEHRVIFLILSERIVVILVLRDRKEAYRGLDNLDDKLDAALVEIEERARALAGK